MHAPFREAILTITLALIPGGFLPTSALAAPLKKTKLQASLSKSYLRGQQLFEEKKFEAALEPLTQLVQKQPDFAPGRLLYARCLYQLQRPQDALKIFQNVEDEFFDPAAFYEAGQTAYSLNQFAVAARFFMEVPEGHPLFDMAGYYGGIAAFKNGDYEAAIDLLDQAVVLPSKLVRTQQAFRREAERLEAQRQKAELGDARSSSAAEKNSSSLALPAPALEDGQGERSYRALRPIRSIALLPHTVLQKQTSVLGEEQDYAIHTEEIRLSMGFSHEDSARSAHYVLQAETAFWGVQGSSKEIPLFADVRREQEFYIIRQKAPKTIAYIAGDAGVEWPIFDQHALGLHLGVYAHVPEHYEVGNLFSPWTGAFYAYRSSLVETQLSAGFHARFENEDPLFFTNVQAAHLLLKLPAGIRFRLQGELFESFYERRKDADEPIDGPELTGRGVVELGYQNENFLSVFIGGVYENSVHVRQHVPGVGDLDYDLSTQGFRARAELGLTKWLRLSGSWVDVEREASRIIDPGNILAASFVSSITEYSGSIVVFDNF